MMDLTGDSMDESLKELSNEHKNILTVIGAVLKECDAIEKGKDLDQEFFKNTIDFVKEYADNFHHAKEEDFLFKEMCKNEENMHCNPTQQMLHEHDLGRNYIKELEDALKNNDSKKAVENAREYCYLLDSHIGKEDNILYPMADMGLSKETKELMKETFQDVEIKFKDIKEKQLKFVESLKDRN